MSRKIELPDGVIYQGHVLDVLRELPDESVNCIVTSPPYWGLRDYGEDTKAIWGGDPNCEHAWEVVFAEHDNLRPSKVSERTSVGTNRELRFRTGKKVEGAVCSKCGAWYGQLGLEPTLELYIEHLLSVAAELKRVLRKDGIMFWVHGDSYGGTQGKYAGWPDQKLKLGKNIPQHRKPERYTKCLLLQNFRLVMRMVDEQKWVLRNVIIWEKPTCPAQQRTALQTLMSPSLCLRGKRATGATSTLYVFRTKKCR